MQIKEYRKDDKSGTQAGYVVCDDNGSFCVIQHDSMFRYALATRREYVGGEGKSWEEQHALVWGLVPLAHGRHNEFSPEARSFGDYLDLAGMAATNLGIGKPLHGCDALVLLAEVRRLFDEWGGPYQVSESDVLRGL